MMIYFMLYFWPIIDPTLVSWALWSISGLFCDPILVTWQMIILISKSRKLRPHSSNSIENV